VNITDNTNYFGTSTAQLLIKDIPSSFYGYQFRCNAGAVYSSTFILKLTSYWKGVTNTQWENPLNWDCGAVPDGNTDVIINNAAPNRPQVNSNTSCRSINVSPGRSLKINTGAKLTVTH